MLLIQYVYYFLVSLALTVATGVYLFNIEESQTCLAPNRPQDWGRIAIYVDVGYRFTIVIKLLFAASIIDLFRILLVLVGIIIQSRLLAVIYSILMLNDLLGLASFIILHVYRLQYAGKACSCDDPLRCFQDGLQQNELEYEHPITNQGDFMERGKFLLGLIIFMWVQFAVICCINCSQCIINKIYRKSNI